MSTLLSSNPVQNAAPCEDGRSPNVRQKALQGAPDVVQINEDFLFGSTEELEMALGLFPSVFRRSFKTPSHCIFYHNSTSEGFEKARLSIHD